MRWVAGVAAALVLAMGAGSAQAPPAKLALVIGNADYNGDARIDVSEAGLAASEAAGFVPDLRNPLNDAADIRDALRGIGFRVDYVQNADGAGMSTALANFGAKVAEAPTDAQVVIYYAGHAIQVDGANFLIPVGAKLPAADFSRMPSTQAQTILGRVAVSTNEVLDQFREPSAPGVNLLILDSCRNNPWERRMRGLSRTAAQTRGMADLRANIARTIVAFATQPGDVAQDGSGRNSPYAGVLKDWIKRPELSVLQMLDGVGAEVSQRAQQTPWFQSASIGESCLVRCIVRESAEAAELLRRVREAGRVADARTFVSRYPDSPNAEEVRGLMNEAPVRRYKYTAQYAIVPDEDPPATLSGAKTFLMFYPRGEHALVPTAYPIIAEIMRQCGGTARFARVTGYDDTVLLPSRAIELSYRRAKLAADYLIEMGVPFGVVRVVAAGQSDPLLPTGQDVSEPQNRRAVVDIVC